jgi:hypothetical protein
MENDADPWLSAPGAWVSLAALLRTVERVLGIPPSEATLVLRPSLEKGLIHAEVPEWSELPTERQDWFWVDPERISPKGGNT